LKARVSKNHAKSLSGPELSHVRYNDKVPPSSGAKRGTTQGSKPTGLLDVSNTLRRKKCDERRNSENNCQSCVRLEIECLGWEENRPEWFQDAERVRVFKKAIKDRTSTRNKGSESSLASIIAATAPPPPTAGNVRPNQPHSATRPAPSSLLPNPISILELNPYPSVPFLQLPSSLLRPATPFSQECFNYRFFIENAQKLANLTELPIPCIHGVRETSLLGRWKQDELDRGRLSNRELARRARTIEEKLNTEYEVASEDMIKHGNQSQQQEEDMLEYFTWVDEEADQA
ncbi:9036_t:CDS:2, partial [Acaulospora colombiana]